MKITRLFLILVICFMFILLPSCNKESSYEGKTKVEFVLEGGSYQNCTEPIVYYFDFTEDKTCLIYEPTTLSQKDIIRAGYYIEGWYQTKNDNGGNVTYSDKWDFSTSKVSTSSLTLYARWVKEVKYTYNLGYMDQDVFVSQHIYETTENGYFRDSLKYNQKRLGYTALGYFDENGNPWDSTFKHPGGDVDTEIKVIIKYIQGEYAVVNNKSDLLKYSSQSIYLNADIDLEGESISFDNYKGTFLGNGHTISNGKISYDNSEEGLLPDINQEQELSLYISLFGNTKNATIKDVTFSNMTIDVEARKYKQATLYKIYVSPLASTATSTVFDNVCFSGTYTIKYVPTTFDTEENLHINSSEVYLIETDSKVNNCTVSLTLND